MGSRPDHHPSAHLRRALALAVGAGLLASCRSGAGVRAATTSTVPAPVQTVVTATTADVTVPPSSTAAIPAGRPLPISVSAGLSSSGQDPSVLQPSSCVVAVGSVHARGAFTGGFVPEGYRRYGDVVELYAYNSAADPPSDSDLQVLDLARETPGSMAGGGTWTASAPVDGQVGQPLRCFVAVQSTHAFMAAGNAGG